MGNGRRARDTISEHFRNFVFIRRLRAFLTVRGFLTTFAPSEIFDLSAILVRRMLLNHLLHSPFDVLPGSETVLRGLIFVLFRRVARRCHGQGISRAAVFWTKGRQRGEWRVNV